LHIDPAARTLRDMCTPLSALSILLTLALAPLAQAAGDIAIYRGVEKYSSVGGGTSNSGEGSSSGKRRQSIYLLVNTATGDVQKVRLTQKPKRFTVESAVRFDQVRANTGGRRSKETVRLTFLNRQTPTENQTTSFFSQYEGRTSPSLESTVLLRAPYARVLRWNFFFQYSGFTVDPPTVSAFPQIDTGSTVLALDRNLTSVANLSEATLAGAVDIVRGSLAQKGFVENPTMIPLPESTE
jgi:hypothetical protein